MKRRQFIKTMAPVALPVVIPGIAMQAYSRNPFMDVLPFINTDRVLVMIQFTGGCDGLNMVIPVDQYTQLANARSNIILPQSSILSLDGTQATGFHPALAELRGMYDEGQVSVIQGVAYADQNFSHFRSTDIWMTGSGSSQVLTTGWSGRYLDYEYPGAPGAYPSESMPDPLAIQIGNSVSQVFWGANGVLGYSLENTSSFYNIINGTSDPVTETYFGDELSYLREVSRSANAYAQSVANASNAVTSQYSGYPSGNTLADHLKIVARLIKGGLRTRMYLVSLGSFDTHSNQVNTDNLTGTQPNLLSQFSKAVKAFYEDLRYLQIDHRVMGMTFSEFGRRIKSNASRGTDHGMAAPLFVFGSGIQGGLVGTNPVIPAAATSSDNVALQHDYRQVYSTILKDWFCTPAQEMNTVFSSTWPILGFIQPTFAGQCNPIAIATQDINLDVEILKNGDHALTWDVQREEAGTSYEIQFSPDGQSFQGIGTLPSDGALGGAEYQYLHYPSREKTFYYRIKSLGPGNQETFSNTVVKRLVALSLSVYPIPAVHFINVKMNRLEENKAYQLRLMSVIGAQVWQSQVQGSEFSASVYRIPVSNLSPGTYVLQVQDEAGLASSQKLMIAGK